MPSLRVPVTGRNNRQFDVHLKGGLPCLITVRCGFTIPAAGAVFSMVLTLRLLFLFLFLAFKDEDGAPLVEKIMDKAGQKVRFWEAQLSQVSFLVSRDQKEHRIADETKMRDGD